MKSAVFFLVTLAIIFSGCSRENPIEPKDDIGTGAVVLKFDRENAPASIVTVTASLTRPGYNPIISQMNLLSDTTADISLNNITAGIWHLKVDAKNQSGVIEYTGETDVEIIVNNTIQVSLVLQPVAGGTGNIYIFVTWGQQGSTWHDSPANPVLIPSQNPSNPAYIGQSNVIFENGIYKMWYNTVYNGAVIAIWYAESNDGKSWTTIGNQPVLTRGNYTDWDGYSVSVHCVIKDSNNYKMYYCGWNTHPNYTPWKIGVAFSQDGKLWTKHPQPILTEENKYYQLCFTSVLKYNETYYGYLGYHNSSKSYIGLATSPDGINWTYYTGNPILSTSTSWEGNGLYYPSVIYDGNKFRMCYEVRNSNKFFGMAESENPFSFIKNTNPIFSTEQSNQSWNSIGYPNFLKMNDEYRIYYTGYDGNIANGICFISKLK